MNHLQTWQDRIIWSSRFIGICLILVAIARNGTGYFVSGVVTLVFGVIADWLIPDHVRSPKQQPKRSSCHHSRSPEHA